MVAKLSDAYFNIFTEFLNAKQPRTLRLLPLSSGIFSGGFKHEMPEITIDAI